MAVPFQEFLAAASRALDVSAGRSAFTNAITEIIPQLDISRSATKWDSGSVSLNIRAGEHLEITFPRVPLTEFHRWHNLSFFLAEAVAHPIIVHANLPVTIAPQDTITYMKVDLDCSNKPNLLGFFAAGADDSSYLHGRPIEFPPGCQLRLDMLDNYVAVGPDLWTISWLREIMAPPGLVEPTGVPGAPVIQIL